MNMCNLIVHVIELLWCLETPMGLFKTIATKDDDLLPCIFLVVVDLQCYWCETSYESLKSILSNVIVSLGN